jgi:hypothetical protein
MFKLDNALLEELLQHIYETLEMRVGMKLAEQMTNDQLDEFEAFIDKNDEAGALKWLETNFPNYKQVVAEQLELLKNEVRQAAPQIVAASRRNAAAMPGPTPGMPAPGLAPVQPGPAPAPEGWQPPQPPPPPQPQPQYTPPSPFSAPPSPPQPQTPLAPTPPPPGWQPPAPGPMPPPAPGQTYPPADNQQSQPGI